MIDNLRPNNLVILPVKLNELFFISFENFKRYLYFFNRYIISEFEIYWLTYGNTEIYEIAK